MLSSRSEGGGSNLQPYIKFKVEHGIPPKNWQEGGVAEGEEEGRRILPQTEAGVRNIRVSNIWEHCVRD